MVSVWLGWFKKSRKGLEWDMTEVRERHSLSETATISIHYHKQSHINAKSNFDLKFNSIRICITIANLVQAVVVVVVTNVDEMQTHRKHNHNHGYDHRQCKLYANLVRIVVIDDECERNSSAHLPHFVVHCEENIPTYSVCLFKFESVRGWPREMR
jgi:hypothetical protein